MLMMRIYLISTSGAKNGDDSWILNFECLFHMCPNNELLYDYQAFDGDLILIGNKYACKTVGI